MNEDDLGKVHRAMIRQGVVRHKHTGTQLRKLKKGDHVRIVEDKFRRATEKSDIGKAHLEPGIHWQKVIRLVEKATHSSVWNKTALPPYT